MVYQKVTGSQRRSPHVRPGVKTRSVEVEVAHRDKTLRESAGKRFSAVVLSLARAIDSPRALGMWLRFKYGEFEQLASVTILPGDYLFERPDRFAEDYGLSEYLSKYKGYPPFVDLKAIALSAFSTAEAHCRDSNARLKDQTRLTPAFNAVMLTAKRKIADLLGECPKYFDFSQGMWGPGVTVTLKGDMATLYDKLRESSISVSRTAVPYLAAELGRDLHWANARGIPAEAVFTPLPCEFKITDFCTVTTVPKNSKTDRTIAIEPSGNIFLQKGVGRFIRERLRTIGIDLNDQSVNQGLAREGSITGLLATLDLKAASDTVCRELVAQLLPYDWWCLLDRLRSRCYRLPDSKTSVSFEKFSTMGNGFTFELESLLFWAICSAASLASGRNGWCAVYGDDLVVETSVVAQTCEALQGAGFTLNLKKSHWTSPFRESCGGHYFGGRDVTPIYQKETLATYEECLAAANRIHRKAFGHMQDPTVLPRSKNFERAWKSCIHGLEPNDFVPLDVGEDTGLAVRASDLHCTVPANGGLLVRSLNRLPVSRRLPSEDDVGLALWLRSHGGENLPFDCVAPAETLRPDVSHVISTSLRERYRLRRKTRWYPGATELGFAL